MNAIDIIALITTIVLVVQNAARIPDAVAGLIRACLPVVRAARDLMAAIRNPSGPPAEQRPEDPDLS